MSTRTRRNQATSPSRTTWHDALSRDDELALAWRWRQHGDSAAADALIRSHLALVASLARRYSRYPVARDELIAEGNLGIVYALQKFEPERGLRFATYAAYWIKACILEHVVKSWSLVGGGGALRSRLFFKLRRERTRAANVFGDGEAADSYAADRLGVTTTRFKALVERLDGRDLRLDAPASGQSLPNDVLVSADDQELLLSQARCAQSVAAAVQRAVAGLDPRERYIAERRLLADSADEMSLTEIGRQLGVSRERARQLEDRAKRKLRKRLPGCGDAAFNEWLGHLAHVTRKPAASSAATPTRAGS